MRQNKCFPKIVSLPPLSDKPNSSIPVWWIDGSTEKVQTKQVPAPPRLYLIKIFVVVCFAATCYMLLHVIHAFAICLLLAGKWSKC